MTSVHDKSTILIVEDDTININVLVELLKNDYKLIVAKTGTDALQRAGAGLRPDLVLLDVMLPDLDGYTVCQKLKENSETRDIPVLFTTSKNRVDDEIKGLSLGAEDYITKPFSPLILKSRIAMHLNLKSYRERLQNQNKFLEEMVAERTRDIMIARDMAFYSMAIMAEQRDKNTGNHIKRTQAYMLLLCNYMKKQPLFTNIFSVEYLNAVYKASALHDIGKVSIPDPILNKPGRLTDEEFQIIKTHPQAGYQTIVDAENVVGQESYYLNTAKDIILFHHEKWDGTGYPTGTAGEKIPLAARLMAISDVFDALVSERVYKPPYEREKVISIMQEGRGTHFDPQILDIFLELQNSFFNIAENLKD